MFMFCNLISRPSESRLLPLDKLCFPNYRCEILKNLEELASNDLDFAEETYRTEGSSSIRVMTSWFLSLILLSRSIDLGSNYHLRVCRNKKKLTGCVASKDSVSEYVWYLHR